MMPAYRSMDTYPSYQRNQMPYPHFWYPDIEANPPQIQDPPKLHFPCEQPWPYYGRPNPMHFCCGHNNHFPGYHSYYRPPYPYAPPPPSPMYHSGCYPPYGEPLFVPYQYHSQPHYAMELPARYEYDKFMPKGYHCCGCPNHPCHQKEEKGVKIEEQEPAEAGKKVSDDALVPAQMKNQPSYPFVWIPPEYIGTGELKNPDHEKISHDRKPPSHGNSRVWNGWLPFEMNGFPTLVHEGDGRNENRRRESEDGKMNQKHQSEHKKPEFPFPIIWMPYYNKQEEKGGNTNNQESTSPKCIEEAPHTLKLIPVSSKAGEGVTDGIRTNQVESKDTSGSDVTKEVTNERSIHMKKQGKNDLDESDKREMNVPVHQMEENVTKKDSQSSVESQSTSPRKTSKLPPVCLRVDPLPRKKSGNGSSRSPSPPASKQHSQVTDGEKSKTLSRSTNDKAQPNSNCQNDLHNNEKEVKAKEKTIQVSETNADGSSKSSSPLAAKEQSQATTGETSKTLSGSTNEKAQPNLNVPNNTEEVVKPKERIIQVTEKKPDENKVCVEKKQSHTDGDKEETTAEKGAEDMMEKATEPREVADSSKPNDDEVQKEKKVLSDADAAVMIQAAYRGYQVRKWEPLKKLKQLVEVNKEVADIKERIEAFEHSCDLQNDDKQRIAIGETIMRLLLKLDTIQGLQSSFRESRKSLAKELICMQERLDSLVTKKPQQQMQDSIGMKSVEDAASQSQNVESAAKQQEENSTETPKDSSECTSHGSNDKLEEDQVKFSVKDDDINSLPADESGSKPQLPVESAPKQQEENSTETAKDSSECTSHGSNDKLEENQVKFSMKDDDINNLPADESGSKPQSPVDPALHEGTGDVVPLTGLVNEDVSPVAVVDACESPTDLSEADKMDMEPEAKTEEDKILHLENELPVGVIDEDVVDEVNYLEKEFPVGVIDEDVVDLFSKKDEQNEKVKEDGLPMVDSFESKIVDPEINPMTELPVGWLDEDIGKSEFEENEKTETSKEVLPDEDGKCNFDKTTSSTTDDAAKVVQLEQHQLEEQEEVQSSGETDGWVKVEFQNEDECKGNAPKDIEVTGNDAEVLSLTTQVNVEELPNGECMVEKYADNMQLEPEGSVINSEKNALINDSRKEEEPEEKDAQKDAQLEGQDILVEKGINAEAEDTDTLTKEKAESEEMPVCDDEGSNGDMKLREENEKLRKMMKKLLESGNEQLNVISDLTGRVKDLEKKLARNKRMKTRRGRYRPKAAKIHSSDSEQRRAIGVAM